MKFDLKKAHLATLARNTEDAIITDTYKFYLLKFQLNYLQRYQMKCYI